MKRFGLFCAGFFAIAQPMNDTEDLPEVQIITFDNKKLTVHYDVLERIPIFATLYEDTNDTTITLTEPYATQKTVENIIQKKRYVVMIRL